MSTKCDILAFQIRLSSTRNTGVDSAAPPKTVFIRNFHFKIQILVRTSKYCWLRARYSNAANFSAQSDWHYAFQMKIEWINYTKVKQSWKMSSTFKHRVYSGDYICNIDIYIFIRAAVSMPNAHSTFEWSWRVIRHGCCAQSLSLPWFLSTYS